MCRSPFTKAKWTNWVLIPFKLYVVSVFPFYLVFRILLGDPIIIHFTGVNASRIDHTTDVLLAAYALCAPFLVLGAVLQAIRGDVKPALQTFAVAAVPLLLLTFLLFLFVVAHLL
ncbi:MAG TPA: hypothetical protein VMP11_09705 [Verrucomicrobiae bacterium]|nr:hypothetical protein [Verrucomicrobiae bacterium]